MKNSIRKFIDTLWEKLNLMINLHLILFFKKHRLLTNAV
jgi:hypothetical protein